MIDYGCPNCDADMSSPNNMAGGQETCQECGTAVIVPDPIPGGPSNSMGDNLNSRRGPSQRRRPGSRRVTVVNNAPKSNGLGVAGLVLGIIALVGCWLPGLNFLSIIIGVIGLILGLVGFFGGRSSKKPTGAALAGAICSFSAITIAIIVNVVIVAGIKNELKNLPKQINNGAREINEAAGHLNDGFDEGKKLMDKINVK